MGCEGSAGFRRAKQRLILPVRSLPCHRIYADGFKLVINADLRGLVPWTLRARRSGRINCRCVWAREGPVPTPDHPVGGVETQTTTTTWPSVDNISRSSGIVRSETYGCHGRRGSTAGIFPSKTRSTPCRASPSAVGRPEDRRPHLLAEGSRAKVPLA